MKKMLVQDWMRTDVISVNPELRVERVWEIMERERVRHLPVLDKSRLVGIVTERDLKRTVFPVTPPFPRWREGKPQSTGTPGDLPVSSIMTTEVHTVKPTESILQAALLMLTYKVRSLPVIDAVNALIGIVTETDLLKLLVALLQEEVHG
jgi:acetoin utilization protein AcuB